VDVEYPLDVGKGTVWFSGTVTPLSEDRVLWVVRDVSDTKEAAEALKESEARFRYLVEQSPQAVVLHAEGRLLYANPACATLLGFTDAEKLIGAPLFRFITNESAPRLMESLGSLGRSSTRAMTCECQFKRSNDARILAVEVTSVPVTYNGRAGVISILHDVTERKQLEDQLAHQAFHDPLTNLANRVLFRDRVEHAIQRAAGGMASPAVLLIDLDNFKAVNDGLGHSAGDWLLIEVAARLLACLRPADTVARLGGDEFAVLLDDNSSEARITADCILEAFKVPFSVHGTDIGVTMSIGIAPVLPHQGADEVLRNADLALYRAKGEGKACAASFEPEMHVAALRRLEIEGELRRAINGEKGAGELIVYYQPIARLLTGKMFGFEALVRWQHPERGLLEPLDFISLAEETGLIVPLGRWVLREAALRTRDWQKRFGPLLRGSGTSLMVAVNLSGRHLAQPELLDDVADTLRVTGLAPNSLVLEMTESMLVHDNRATLERLHSLKSLGVRLSIDDFGTGYSSLAYLERFPVDTLKMDRSFIEGLGTETSNSPLAEAVIGLGRILGLKVVAEGIETQEQWDRLRVLGCALGQGYHISRPLAAPSFERLIMSSIASSTDIQATRFPGLLPGSRSTPVSGIAATA
jgi:diguanylate cyclase (GGDEF)-like protein/PAS domain S-box-containing protein